MFWTSCELSGGVGRFVPQAFLLYIEFLSIKKPPSWLGSVEKATYSMRVNKGCCWLCFYHIAVNNSYHKKNVIFRLNNSSFIFKLFFHQKIGHFLDC